MNKELPCDLRPIDFSDKYLLHHNEFEVPEIYDLHDLMESKIVKDKGPILFGCEVPIDIFIKKFDIAWCFDGPSLIVHEKILKKFNNLCSKDFQALQCKIVNYTNRIAAYENFDYHMINILNYVDAVDEDRSEISVSSSGRMRYLEQPIFKPNSLNGHMIARERNFPSWKLFQPELVAALKGKHKGARFVQYE